MAAHLTAFDQTRNHTFDVPVKDPAVAASRFGGSYPWSIEGDTESIIHVRNTTQEKTSFVLQIDYEGGSYALPAQVLDPGQERAVDIKQLRDGQVKDSLGMVIPLDVERGQATWIENGSQALTGRIEIFSVSAGVTLTYTASGGNTPGSYQLPAVLLPPHATRFVNLKEILSAGQPDQEGNVVPSDVTFGTARVDVTGEASGNALVVAGAVFDPILGTCEGGSFCSNPPILVLIDGFETIRWEFFILLGATIIACEIGCDDTIPPEVTLSCTSPVTRGQSSTCTITVAGAPNGASISFSGWKFDGGGATVTRTTNQSSGTWSGVMVTSGTVSVTATINGTPIPASAAITVTDNNSLAFSPVNPTKVPNNFHCQSGDVLTIPSPPVQGGAFGRGCANLFASVTGTAEVTDGGPNHGYRYVTAVIAQSSQGTTEYDYTISADLENTSGAFFLAQCGNYNEQTNPLGFIGGSVLLSNTINHEIGPVDSHWNNYWRSQVSSATNTGIVLGRVTAPPGVSPEAFNMQLTDVIRSNFAVILSMTSAEPCGSHAVELDPNNFCVFRGFINYPPFMSCK